MLEFKYLQLCNYVEIRQDVDIQQIIEQSILIGYKVSS